MMYAVMTTISYVFSLACRRGQQSAEKPDFGDQIALPKGNKPRNPVSGRANAFI